MRLPTSVCFPLEVREAESEVERGGCPLAPPIPIPPTPRRTPRGSRARWRKARTTNANGLAATPLTRPSPESFSLGVGVSVYLRASPSSSSHWLHSHSSLSSPLRLLPSSGVSQSGALSAQRGVSLSPSPREQARQEELVSSPPPSAMRWRLPFKVGRGMEEEEEEEVTPAAVRRGGRKGGGES